MKLVQIGANRTEADASAPKNDLLIRWNGILHIELRSAQPLSESEG